jgi:putative phosphoribosyl transferase
MVVRWKGIFDALTRRFQLRFKDRVAAAAILANALKAKVKPEEHRDLVVLGIPRGGVITADTVATKIPVPNFDIVIPRKLTDPDNKEQAIGAIMDDGTTYLDKGLITDFQISSQYLEEEIFRQLEEIKRRTSLFVGDTTARNHDFENKKAIIVDDGAATGATLIAAARSVRRRFRLKRLILALPVAPMDTVNLLKRECDEVEVIICPSSNFHSVEQYYQDFGQVMDEQVIEIMRRRGF